MRDLLRRQHLFRICVVAAGCVAGAIALAACSPDGEGTGSTVRIGTTTSVSSVSGTAERPVDHSTSAVSSEDSETSVTAVGVESAMTADVAGWRQTALDVPGDAVLQGGLAFDEDRVAWIASSVDHDDVFVTDLRSGVKRKVTNSSEQVTAIALDGSRLAWVARNSEDIKDPAELALYDLDLGRKTRVTEAPIPTGYMIQVAGDHIAWCQFYTDREGETARGRLALYVYTISSGTIAKLSDRLVTGAWEPNGRAGFDLDINHIAFIETADLNSDGEVWLYDLNAGAKLHLAHSVASSNHVSLQDELVTWASAGKTPRGAPYPASDVSVYRIRDQSSEKIATVYTPEPLPQTDGRYVVWDSYVGDTSFSVRVIQGYDTRKDKLSDISQNLYLNFTPEISAGLVVWERAGESDSEVMARDLLTGQITQLSADAASDQMVRVHGRTVVWCKRWDSGETGTSSESNACVLASAPERFRDAFSDVAGTHRYRTAVQAMFEWGIEGGYKVASDRQYHPEEGVLRAGYVQMVARAFRVAAPGDLSSVFADPGGEGTAGLSTSLTRAQATTMLVGVLDRLHPGLLTSEATRPPGAIAWDDPYLADLERAYAGHLLSGLVGWRQPWDASQPCSRAEAAQLLYNAVMLVFETSLVE